nr:ABC transporter ATP-binding protein [Ruania albidiflava]
MTDLAVETRGLTKRFGHQLAVDSLDLAAPRGSVFALLGPNGSGKTTTIRMLLGLAAATGGTARVLDHEVPGGLGAALPQVGALIEGPAFYPFLTGADNLARLDAADPRGRARTRSHRVAEALERVGLTKAAGKKVRAYSLGMKQRLGLANALLLPRELLVLDEPTNGLDPQGTREVRSLIRSLADGGTTVLVSSHLLAEVEQVSTHAAVMHQGRLKAQGTLAELRAAGTAQVLLRTPDPEAAAAELVRFGLVVTGRQQAADGSTDLTATLPEDAPAPEYLVAELVAAGVGVRGFEVRRPSMEELFVALTGEGFDVAR